ncbi:hypothetical protein B0H19DRAFT_177055 [Mycena capillaripes]|nr:hypothetical protein B0H19DRAFT_177055 [Mycena capillaripes]
MGGRTYPWTSVLVLTSLILGSVWFIYGAFLSAPFRTVPEILSNRTSLGGHEASLPYYQNFLTPASFQRDILALSFTD